MEKIFSIDLYSFLRAHFWCNAIYPGILFAHSISKNVNLFLKYTYAS